MSQPSAPTGAVPRHAQQETEREHNPWVTLWVMVIGFFMILLDTTIVAVANPSIQAGLGVDVGTVIWVTSAYLLAYSVPMLIAGRMGDRYGPRNVYLVGLLIFTIASLWCGLSPLMPGSPVGSLITARAVQGIGGALMSPQTMAVIQRIFPPARRGGAMAIWGAVAGIAGLVGPVLGGVLVDAFGWEWIFFVNVPIGIVALVLGWIYIPKLETHSHEFDWLGVVISAVGVFFLVFGVQEGNAHQWNGWVVGSIVLGVVLLVGFVVWQRVGKGEPLVPLSLFRNRNFSVSTAATTLVGLSVTSMVVPLYYYFQIVRGFSPTHSALMTMPSAVLGILLAPLSGRLVDKLHPRLLSVTGLVLASLGVWLYVGLTRADIAWGWLLVPSTVYGIGNAFVWGPLGATSTRDLPPRMAGAASGVYNTTRQLGSVIGSAAIAAIVTARLSYYLPGASQQFSGGGSMPPEVAERFTSAMTDAMRMPAIGLLVAAVIACFFVRPRAHEAAAPSPAK
ncbi:MAG: MFS transporter [Arachnia sp.]